MAWHDFITQNRFLRGGRGTSAVATFNSRPPANSYAGMNPHALTAWQAVTHAVSTADKPPAELLMVKALMERTPKAGAITIGIPDVGFKGVRQQLFQRYNLIDLYAIAHNNSVLKTATGNLKQEVFRRGFTWDQSFDYRHRETGRDYSLDDLREIQDEDENEYNALMTMLDEPDPVQRQRLEALQVNVNIYDQSLMALLHTIEDDLNISDDGFIFLSSDYYLGWSHGEEIINREVRQLFRLDPVFVEFDVDGENRPGFAHHICLLHREDLLTIPGDDDWQSEWKGRCPQCGHTTFPVQYRYSPYRGTFGLATGMQGPNQQSMYLAKGEVIHVSKFSPSELYGYSPVLSIYEKALSLIGMDRYLYDYFFERKIPQGVITTVTDNVEDLEARKEQMVAQVLEDPHYIPWLAVSSKNGQGKTEFTRFAYSLDELEFLPVQEHIERSVAALYGIPSLFMGFEEGTGGLNNESQQITRLSRGAQLSQEVYNSTVLPEILKAFGITDWALTLETAEEYSEKFELELKQQNASWAQTMVGMGLGMKYNQDTDEYEFFGEVPPETERQEMMQQQEMQQQQMADPYAEQGGYDEAGGEEQEMEPAPEAEGFEEGWDDLG